MTDKKTETAQPLTEAALDDVKGAGVVFEVETTLKDPKQVDGVKCDVHPVVKR